MADDNEDALVAKAMKAIEQHEGEIVQLKVFVNQADKISGREPRFRDISEIAVMMAGSGGMRAPSAKKFGPGSFLGKAFAAAARMVLTARSEANGNEPSPASVDEIQEALLQGSFDFGTNSSESQKQSIKISLGKNSSAFVKLPNTELFGLAEWYPGLKKAARPRRNASTGPDEAAEDAED